MRRGPSLGALLLALLAGLSASLLAAACGGGGGGSDGGGGGGGGGDTAPTGLAYATAPAWYRVGEPVLPNLPSWSGGTPTAFVALPPLPAGLALHATTGAITGTPSVVQPASPHLVTASNAAGSTAFDLVLAVGPPLPPALESLAPGWSAEVLLAGLDIPVRIALSPDGRLFFNELSTGDVRVVGADGTLQATPFAHVDVLPGGHRGLLGLALAPDFDLSGHLFVMASVPGAGPVPDRQQVLRFTDALAGSDWVGTNRTVVVDDLPVGALNDGGEIRFALDGTLFVSVGDVEQPALAQTSGALAGRVLRYAADGSVPADNPFPGSPEWCRGLRNTFAVAVQPVTGDLFGADNGPDSHDELNYLRAGKNFEWGGLPPGFPPQDVGIQVAGWVDVIVPTALAWHPGATWGAAWENDLLVASYDDQAIRRFELSGPWFLDVDAETVFATFVQAGLAHKPLSLAVAPDGTLLVSTFTAIYRITKD